MEIGKRASDPSYRFILPDEFRKEIGSMEWESIAQFAQDLNFRAQRGSKETERMARELELAKLVLLEHISHAKHRAPPAKLLVKTVKLLERCEMLARRHNTNLSDFAFFLTILIEKMKKEKLVVYPAHSQTPQPKTDSGEPGFSHFKEMVEKKTRA